MFTLEVQELNDEGVPEGRPIVLASVDGAKVTGRMRALVGRILSVRDWRIGIAGQTVTMGADKPWLVAYALNDFNGELQAAGVKAPGPVKAFDRVGREIPMPTAYTRNLIGDVPEPEEEPGLNLSVTGTLLKAGRNVIGEALAALDKIPDYDAENIRVPWVVTTRPKLDPELWAESVIESVDIKELHASQKLLTRARVRFYIENPGAIEEGRRAFANVYDRGSELVIVDGHHRLAALWLLGAEMANVWFMEGNA